MIAENDLLIQVKNGPKGRMASVRLVVGDRAIVNYGRPFSREWRCMGQGSGWMNLKRSSQFRWVDLTKLERDFRPVDPEAWSHLRHNIGGREYLHALRAFAERHGLPSTLWG